LEEEEFRRQNSEVRIGQNAVTQRTRKEPQRIEFEDENEDEDENENEGN
jgi:hypothetical protein